MVSTVRFRSFKTIDLQARRPYTVLVLVAIAIILVNVHLPYSLLTLAYGYLTWTFIELAVTRLRHRRGEDRDASGDLKASEEPAAPPARSGFSRPTRR
jgi:phosphatidylserine synthase